MSSTAKGQTVDLDRNGRERPVQSLDLNRMHAAFCGACEYAHDRLGWKYEAIAAALETDPSYFSKIRAAEKPLTLKHIAALPDDIEAVYARLYAESLGHFVVAPITGEDAIKALAGVMVGVTRALPTRADHMAKADIPATQARSVA